MKTSFIFIFFGFAFLFLSCEEPDDPVILYDYSMPRSVGKTINSIDIFWDEAPLNNFQYYDIFYREFYVSEPKHHITINDKKQLYTTITGLLTDTEYKIFIVTTDKRGNKYTSKELSEKTYSDVPGPIYQFRIESESGSLIRFVWNIYENNYAVPFSRYEIYMDTVNNFICNNSNKVVILYNYFSAQVEFNVSDLVPGQIYYFKLRTYNTLEKYRESSQTVSFKKSY